MNRARLILRNLWFYRRSCLYVMAGVMVATAVLTGALIIGDSVRYSLRQITGERLGKTRYALQTEERFFRQALAREISARSGIPVAPALQAGGIAINSDKNLRINRVQVTGIDRRFCSFWEKGAAFPGTGEAVISRNVAARLELKPGDDLLLRVRKPGKLPPDAPFSAEKETSVSLRLKVSAIADDPSMGRFSLQSNQTAPFNVFVPLDLLAAKLDLAGKANIILAGEKASPKADSLLNLALRESWQPGDIGVEITHPDGVRHPDGVPCQVSITRIFFDDQTAKAVQTAIPGCQPVLTYLVNALSKGDRSTPYSFVTAAGEDFLGHPAGPGELLAGQWLAEDLNLRPGDSVTLSYFVAGPLRTLRTDSARFAVRAIIADKNSPAGPGLMPQFPGITGTGSCREWETGAPIDLKKIRDKDEQYWKERRGTPKAFIPLATGQKIWNNPFGHVTAFRFSAPADSIPAMERRLMKTVQPAWFGFTFRDVYREGVSAANEGTGFGELFLSLGFFIIAGALLLTALLFSLLARSRLAEAAILSATGFRRRQILGLMSAEALLISVAGAIPGLALGILYNRLLVAGLNSLWQDAVNASVIFVQVKPLTLAAGALSGIATSLAVMLAVLWRSLRNPPATMVKDEIPAGDERPLRKIRHSLPALAAVACTGASLVLIAAMLATAQTMNVPVFLGAGALLLAGGLLLLRMFLTHMAAKKAEDIPRFLPLALKNISVNRDRTLAVVTLLSLGVFSVVITGANRKTFYGLESDRGSGTGGFILWSESSLPVMNDLNTPAGVKTYSLEDEPLLEGVHYVQMIRLNGEDASCLNLNRVRQPVILGVPAGYFDRVHAFGFASLIPETDRERPWKALQKRRAPDMIDGFADQEAITWSLGKKPGDTLFYRDERGKILKIRIAGGLENSVFQGNILVSDSLLRLFYPSAGGSRVMLVDGPAARRDSIAGRLEVLFRDHGMSVIPTPERLAAFNAVQNTYLSVFMMLGGLGVIIGTIGLGVVILQNLRRRKREFALYLAMGFTRKFILRLILTEHLLMLLAGFFLGILSAAAGILPSLLSPGYTLPGIFLSAILLAILLNGLLWIWLPARQAMKKNVMEGVREE